MSHVTDVRLRIKDVDALKEAAQACGLEFREGQRTYAWWGSYLGDSRQFGPHDPKQFGKCEHALREPGTSPRDGSAGPWEIGVVPAPKGEEGFDLLYDQFGAAGQRLTNLVGANANRLRREYSAAVATRRVEASLGRRGFTVTKESVGPNRLRLRVRKG